MKPTQLILPAILCALLAVQTCRLQRARHAADTNAARADSITAASDTTRFVQAVTDVRRVYGDSMRAVERRIVQVAPQIDRLDRALGRLTAANATLTTRIDALQARVQGVVAVDTATGTRSAQFNLRQPPYTVLANAVLPPSGPGQLDLDVTLDTARLGVRIQCGQPVGGFRPATALVAAPEWLHVALDSLRQAPGVCNPDRPRRWYDGRLTLGPSYSFIVDRSGRVRAGFGVSGQISVLRWP